MIYTKTGDAGDTSLIGGSRVPKNDVRVEAYGTVDELNAHIGLIAEMPGVDASLAAMLKTIQHNLFVIQTLLAVEKEVEFPLPQLPADAVEALEQQIDSLQAQLPTLKTFVIPGGTTAGACCHVARTVCRRAERRIVALAQQSNIDGRLLCYINRLSDYLFVLSRFLVVSQDREELLYTPQG